MEWKCGNLESKANHDQQQSAEENLVVMKQGSDNGQFTEIHLAGNTVYQRDAEHGETGRKRADDQVFDSGLQRAPLGALETGKDVEGDGDQFQ